jgi:hypothetical protein
MGRFGTAIRLMLCIPPVWIAALVLVWAAWINSQDAIVDIALFAVERLF